MNGSLTAIGAQAALNTFTGVAPLALPDPLYTALVTGTSNAATAGTEVTPAQYGGYVRQPLSGAKWSAPSAGQAAYADAVSFGLNAGGAGAAISGLEFFDAPSGGNRLGWSPPSDGTITLPANGGHVQFNRGAISFTVPVLTNGAGFATLYANRLCGHLIGKTAFVPPTAGYYVALMTGQSTADALGIETAYVGYFRVHLPTVGAASQASPSVVAYIADVQFVGVLGVPGPPIVGWALVGDSIDPDLVYADLLSAPYTPHVTDTPGFKSGDMLFRLA